jgi:RNA 3'-terminal phosphate cyclase
MYVSYGPDGGWSLRVDYICPFEIVVMVMMGTEVGTSIERRGEIPAQP